MIDLFLCYHVFFLYPFLYRIYPISYDYGPYLIYTYRFCNCLLCIYPLYTYLIYTCLLYICPIYTYPYRRRAFCILLLAYNYLICCSYACLAVDYLCNLDPSSSYPDYIYPAYRIYSTIYFLFNSFILIGC